MVGGPIWEGGGVTPERMEGAKQGIRSNREIATAGAKMVGWRNTRSFGARDAGDQDCARPINLRIAAVMGHSWT